MGRAHVLREDGEGWRRVAKGDDEQLCIFGPLAARRGAELKTMSAVEHKHPGYCVSSKGELRDVDRVPGDDDEGGLGHRHGAADGRFVLVRPGGSGFYS